MSDHHEGIQINWTPKTYAMYMGITLGGFAIVIGWFKMTLFLMGLAG